jgi:hypothetical protein
MFVLTCLTVAIVVVSVKSPAPALKSADFVGQTQNVQVIVAVEFILVSKVLIVTQTVAVSVACPVARLLEYVQIPTPIARIKAMNQVPALFNMPVHHLINGAVSVDRLSVVTV